MEYTKKQIAKCQIERAIDLFLIDQDFVCSITLAGAAEEMLGNITKVTAGNSLLGNVYEEFKAEYPKFSDFSSAVNRIRNELKHSRENPSLEFELEVDIDDCAQMIYRAIVAYPMATGGETTEKMRDCWSFLRRNHHRIFGGS